MEEACKCVGVDFSSGYRWIRRWNRQGYEGIRSHYRGKTHGAHRAGAGASEGCAELKTGMDYRGGESFDKGAIWQEGM